MKLNIKESIASHDLPDNISATNIEIQSSTPNKIRIYSESEIFAKSVKKKKKQSDTAKKPKYALAPYEQAIKLLKSINRYKVPFEKMMLIATISSEITECVNVFWKDFEKAMTSSLLNIDADELMTIFIYIIIKSQLADLLVHSKFIKEFTTSTTRSSMIGYYYTTLEASLIYILSVKNKSDMMNIDKFRKSLVPTKSSFIHETEEATVVAINNN
jgi:hypothetical protein